MFYDLFAMMCDNIGKKPSAVAADLEIDKSTVSRWKSSNPSYFTLMRIAKYFNVDVLKLKEGSIEYLNKPSVEKQSIGDVSETENGVQMVIEFASKYSKLTEQEQKSINAVIDTFLANHK